MEHPQLYCALFSGTFLEFPPWLCRLRSWHCHCCGSGHYWHTHSIPSPGISTCCRHGRKKRTLSREHILIRRKIERLTRFSGSKETAKSFRKGRLILHATILSHFKSSDFFVGLFDSSLIHDAAAHLQCWKLLPSCPAHLGIHQKSGTEQEPPWTHLSAISAFLGTAKDLHSCKRPHSPQAPRRKSAAPAQIP